MAISQRPSHICTLVLPLFKGSCYSRYYDPHPDELSVAAEIAASFFVHLDIILTIRYYPAVTSAVYTLRSTLQVQPLSDTTILPPSCGIWSSSRR